MEIQRSIQGSNKTERSGREPKDEGYWTSTQEKNSARYAEKRRGNLRGGGKGAARLEKGGGGRMVV